MAIFYPLKTQLLTLFGASENSIGYAVEYFNLILAFFPLYKSAIGQEAKTAEIFIKNKKKNTFFIYFPFRK